VEEIAVSGENHRPVASHWQTLSHKVVNSLTDNSKVWWDTKCRRVRVYSLANSMLYWAMLIWLFTKQYQKSLVLFFFFQFDLKVTDNYFFLSILKLDSYICI
jgi:hypothetical protein